MAGSLSTLSGTRDCAGPVRKRDEVSRVAAYLVVDVTAIHNETAYAQYRSQVSPGLEASGGRYLVRGGHVEVLEGNWQPGRLVVVRFATMEAARGWWSSRDYAPLKSARQRSTATNMVLVEGLPDGELR
jgi:uncharacterized protein (DUF1330 family)